MILVKRTTPSLLTTIGELVVLDTTFKCFTLEDVARALGFKIYGHTAICEGLHRCKITHSNKFGRPLPLIYNQDDYSLIDGRGARWTGLRCHNGQNHKNTDGCILTGYQKGVDVISDPAADDLTKLLLEKFGEKEFGFHIMNFQK